ncbi:MAG: phosphate signaling complex protein PhoU [Chloroflexi bacterium]|nr:phosphate signaling complex protein PhoU [Chloroflexota bacterium]
MSDERDGLPVDAGSDPGMGGGAEPEHPSSEPPAVDPAIPASEQTGPSADALSGPRHARRPLDRDEREIKDNVLRMGALVEEQIRAAIRTLVEHDAEAAAAVIAGDRQINEAQHNVVALITRVIATQQPVARDLRFLLSLDHVAYELERMGDHAASVAKQSRKLAPFPPLKRYVDLPAMGEAVAQLVHGVLRALVDVDEALARQVAARDDEVDHLYHRIFDELLQLMRDHPDNVDRGARLLFAAHYLERIGDRVTNIAEDVVFLASGEISDLND